MGGKCREEVGCEAPLCMSILSIRLTPRYSSHIVLSFQLETSRQQGQREEQQMKSELNACLQEQGRLESEEKVLIR